MISRLEVLLLTLSLIAVSVFCQHNTVVYYHNEIKRQVIQNLECEAMNGTTIIVTAATGKQFSLVYRQRHAIKLMDAVEDNECLLRKMITVCLDEECEEKCMEGRISHCTRYAYVSPGGLDRETQVMPIDYNSGSHGSKEHNKIVALKWKLIEMAFQYGATTVMYMDADVLLLKNPFIDLLKAHNRTYPLLHLTDTGVEGDSQEGCNAPPHTGFMLFSIVGMRNYKYRVFQLASHMLSADHTVDIHEGKKGERSVFAEVLAESQVSHCALPKLRYTGACHHAHDDGVKVEDVVIYHASCGAETSVEKKALLMDHILGHKKEPEKKDADSNLNPFDP